MSNYRLVTGINEHYGFIKQHCKQNAKRFKIDEENLLSAVNMRLGTAAVNDAFEGTEADFKNYAAAAIRNISISEYRLNKKLSYAEIDEPVFDIMFHSEEASNYENIDLLRKLIDYFNAPDRSRLSSVFNAHFLIGLNYEEVAEHLQMPIGTVKNIIFKIRKLAVYRFQKQFYY